MHLAKSFNDRRKVNLPTTKLHKTVRMLWISTGRQLFDILYMKKEQTVAVFPDRPGRIASPLEIVRDIQLQLDVARIGRLQNLVHRLGSLAQRAHVIVISQRDSQV